MDITPQDSTIQPISDDQELAKALAGVLPDEPETAATNDLQFGEVSTLNTPALSDTPAAADPASAVVPPIPDFSVPEISIPEATSEAPTVTAPAVSGDLNDIKNQALNELRPLIDRVDLPSEDRFDAYLMLLRSTDDSTLVGPAHAAAQGIADEKRKAEALLEIIKEIDYLSRKSTPAAS